MWRRIIFWLAPGADESCKDESRFYYLPSCPPGADRRTFRNTGRLLAWQELRPIAAPTGSDDDDSLGKATNRVGGLDLDEYLEGITEGERNTKLFAWRVACAGRMPPSTSLG